MIAARPLASGVDGRHLASESTFYRLLHAAALEEPLYLTTTHAWYRSGTQVRRVLK